MKGIYIFEEAFLKDAVACLKLSNIEHKFKCEFGETITEEVDLHALVENSVSKSRCNKDDTYDFETGALIALMKMCGVEKVTKACDELYKDNNYKNALQEMTENCEKLIKENNYLNYVISCRESAIESLENTRDLLINKNNELIEENEKLKSDCEKLCHGYNGNDMIFCGGRQNGKQYKALVDLFKKIDQKKVDAAYKEAYNTKLPLWQKEVLKQMYGIYKESKEKIELPRTLDINGTVYRKTIQIKDFGEEIKPLHNDQLDSLIEQNRAFTRKCVDEWLYGPPTKRGEMWENIKNFNGVSCVEVDRADIIDFLKDVEKEMPKVHWSSGAKPTGKKPMFNYKYDHEYDKIFFFVDGNYMSYGYYKETSREKVQYVTYLPPMRWDLFKKGRLAVKINYDNYKEFCEACEKELGKKPSTYLWDDVTISICKKDDNFEIFTIEHQKKTGRKIVDWEDVR